MEEFQQNLSKDEDNSLGVSNMGVNEDCILGHQMLWEGPTLVSASIHAATRVIAGLFMSGNHRRSNNSGIQSANQSNIQFEYFAIKFALIANCS